MSGLRSRNRGKAGQREAEAVLTERDFIVMESAPGKEDCDFLAIRNGKTYAVEVKHQKLIQLDRFRAQAREQAARRKTAWLLMCRLAGHRNTFLVEGTDQLPTVWRSRGEAS